MRTIEVVMRRKTAKIKTRPWDPAEHLTTEGDMAAYLEAALEDGDPALIAAALGDIARAKGMSQIARETVWDERAFTKRYHQTATRNSPRCSRSCARSASACTQWPMLNHGFVPWQARLERGSNVPARRHRQNSRRQGDAGAQESGSLDPREMSKGKT